MDFLSIAGIVVAFTAVFLGNALEGGHFSSLVQLTAFIIVVGGTVGATMLQTPLAIFLRAFKMLVWVFLAPKRDAEKTIGEIVSWSTVARRDGLLSLESVIETAEDPFVAKGLQLLVDGLEPEALRRLLEVEVESVEHRDTQSAKVFEAMGGYSPTVGILGAVLGLIHVMNNLTDPSKLGGGIAVAFVATIYGVGLANLVFLPLSNKLKALVGSEVRLRDMIIEGLSSISEGENPKAIEAKLKGYVH